MDKKRLDYYKKKLLTRREELMRTIARTQEEGRAADEDPTVDLADKAANSYTKEFLSRPMNTGSVPIARKRCSRSAWKLCRGRNTASSARKKWSKAFYSVPRAKEISFRPLQVVPIQKLLWREFPL